jgi:2-dehydropantoate 2-reductase
VEPRLNWLIIGAGAIGTYIGGSLLLRGQKVIFFEQPGVAEEIRGRGLQLNINGQDYRILHPEVYSSLDHILSTAYLDIAIFALKSFDTQAALEMIGPLAEKFPAVLCLQNGVENEALLKSVLGKGKVIAGTVTSAVGRRGPGDVILERARGMGIASGHPLSSKVAQALSDAHLNAHIFKSATAMKWSKMLTNLQANASSAILDMTPLEILSDHALYRMEIAQLREAIAVMKGLNLSPVDLPGAPVRLFAFAVKSLSPALSQPLLSRIAGGGRGQKLPSFHIDLHGGRGKSEVDYLNGAVVRFGERLGIATPINRWLNETVLGLTSGRIALDEYRHQPEKFLRTLYLGKVVD